MLLDHLDLVVHVQHSEEREFYGLERLWKDCPGWRCLISRPALPTTRLTGGHRPCPGRGDWPVTRRLVLWRHGQTAWNAEKRFQGQRDVDLDATGVAQARIAAGMLAQLPPTAIVSSDLSRARVTAEALAEATRLPVTYDARLRETDAGEWQGLARPELMARFAGEVAAWAAVGPRPGGGERRSEVAARMTAAIGDAFDRLDEPDPTLVVVSHGESARGRRAVVGPADGALGNPRSAHELRLVGADRAGRWRWHGVLAAGGVQRPVAAADGVRRRSESSHVTICVMADTQS